MLHRSLKRNLVIGLAALVVAACAGGAYAATQNSGPTTRQAFLNDVAKRLHVTPKELSSALSGATQDEIQAEVKAGMLTQAQANALEQRLKSSATAPLLPLAPGLAGRPRLFGGGGPWPRGFGGPFGGRLGGRFGGPFGFPGAGLGAAASYLGLTDMQLLQQLSAGKSLAEIATANGKTVAGLEQAITAQVKKALDAAVSAKAISATRESQILSGLSARLKQAVNQKGLHTFRAPAFRGPARPPAPGNPPQAPVFPAAPANPSAPSA
jgi:hypothetical protein